MSRHFGVVRSGIAGAALILLAPLHSACAWIVGLRDHELWPPAEPDAGVAPSKKDSEALPVGSGGTDTNDNPPLPVTGSGGRSGSGDAHFMDGGEAGGRMTEGGLGAFEVTTVDPSRDAERVDRSPVIAVAFSAELDASTVNADTVQLLDGSAVVPCELDIQGDRLTLTPVRKLDLLRSYTIRLYSSISAVSGERLKGADAGIAWESSFTIRDGKWNAPLELPSVDGAAARDYSPLVTDGIERVLAVFAQSPDVASRDRGVYGRLYHPSPDRDPWSSRFEISIPPAICSAPAAAMNENGDMVVAWLQWGNRNDWHVWARRYAKGVPEPGSHLLDESTDVQSMGPPTVFLTPDGYAEVLWSRPDPDPARKGQWLLKSVRGDVRGDRWSKWSPERQLGWTDGVVRIPDATRLSSSGPFLTLEAQGVVWGGHYEPAPAVRWSFEMLGSGVTNPLVASDDEGGALAVWHRPAIGVIQPGAALAASRYTPAVGWSSTIENRPLSTDVIASSASALAFDGHDFVVAYLQGAGGAFGVYIDRFSGSAWKGPKRLSDAGSTVTSVSLAFDRRGNGLAFWTQAGGVTYARYLGANDEWLPPVEYSTAGAGFLPPSLSVLGDGSMIAAWGDDPRQVAAFE